MPVETFYMSRQADGTTKKLGRLKGWRREVAELLLRKGKDDEIKAEIEMKVVSPESAESKSKNENYLVEQTLALLPKNSRGKARILAKHLLNHLQVNNNGQIVYSDGSIGSAFIDVLKYFCSPRSRYGKIRAPFDVEKMISFLRETSVPVSATVQNIYNDPLHSETGFTKKWVSI